MAQQHLVNDCVVAVIDLMNRKNIDHIEAFREMSDNLGITYNSVKDSCVRRIGLKGVKDFSKLVKCKEIRNYLKSRYPDSSSWLDKAF
ncbi:MAG TPA: hypothetical protein VI548_08445 [Chitinophagaceae bacterium]|nr:hypothetical protein [Chitinophagaceae bacterium]